jgi:hypothetical protein
MILRGPRSLRPYQTDKGLIRNVQPERSAEDDNRYEKILVVVKDPAMAKMAVTINKFAESQ